MALREFVPAWYGAYECSTDMREIEFYKLGGEFSGSRGAVGFEVPEEFGFEFCSYGGFFGAG